MSQPMSIVNMASSEHVRHDVIVLRLLPPEKDLSYLALTSISARSSAVVS